MSRIRGGPPPAPDNAAHHRDWLSLVEVGGPFLSLPVLRETWPAGLDALDKPMREALRRDHGVWQDDKAAGQHDWVVFVLSELLGLADTLHVDKLDPFEVEVAEHDAVLTPSFVVLEPDGEVKPDAARLLGAVWLPGQHPTTRLPGEAWAATPVDRMAQMCRHHDVELGLVTDGRWWALVWAPRGGVTGVALFDASSWAEAAERDVVRAFVSLLGRQRFFGEREEKRLVPLLRASLDSQEEITDRLGVQVRQAVELLVTAIGRADVAARKRGERGVEDVDAHDVYRGAVSIMMRVVFLLFAEERGLLPSDNELYARAYSAGRLGAELEQRALEGSEEDLEHSTAAWHRLIALFEAVHGGVDHPRLQMPGHDGGLFDPENYLWLPLSLDDRTVLHMLRAVQYVTVGKGKNAERRALSFKTLDVEQIGYVYEGLLSFEGYRADGVVLGLVGKEGLEEEVPLGPLEDTLTSAVDVATFAAGLSDLYKSSGIGSAAAITKRLAPLDATAAEEARKKFLAVTDGDYPLAERLLPLHGLIRTDLRGLPVVILPGALYVTESALRRNTGTHYTPRKLAEEVVLHALEPLVYSPGPLQTADRAQWVPLSSKQILALKVADIAVGSAAFLVAAARYLGERLLEAWMREDDVRVRELNLRSAERAVDADDDPVSVEARRQIIEHCLYGVDINPMAVEMAKLSLWLVSMDPTRPFTFVDDRLVAGDSLLGITSLEQLEYLHTDPARGRKLHNDLFGWAGGVRSLVADVAKARRHIADIDMSADPEKALEAKRAILAETDLRTGRLRFFADLAVSASLAHAPGGKRAVDSGSVVAAKLIKDVVSGHGEVEALLQRRKWLDVGRVDGLFGREPLHWPLVFPEVFEIGGFDAVIGNPPFLHGTKITANLGVAYREHLIGALANDVRGNSDVVVYFVLRCHDLIRDGGQVGVVATNSLAQGDSREVGLDQLLNKGITIRRAFKSRTWPTRGATLEYCLVWTSRLQPTDLAQFMLDGQRVKGITASLDPLSRVSGKPHRLAANRDISFKGSDIGGIGFTLSIERAGRLLDADCRLTEVLEPFLNGKDVNSDSSCAASRWVINFRDWPEDRAREYLECYEQVRELVKPERDRNNRKVRRERWWQFSERATTLYRAILDMDYCLVMAAHSKTALPVRVPARQVMSHGLVVFATEDFGSLALLSSALHYWWASAWASTIKTDLRYTPTDVFETFPMPQVTAKLRDLGAQLDASRRDIMRARHAGLTDVYHLFHDPLFMDSDITQLRNIHLEIDLAVVGSYGWSDLLELLDYGFHPVARETRYTIGPTAQCEILDRLLELNHERYAEEVAKGLHDKGKKRGKVAPPSDDGGLF
jgi:hypothetical protein